MDSLIEFNEWFTTLSHDDDAVHHPPESADSSLRRSTAFYDDLETGLPEFEILDKDVEEEEEDPSLTDTSISSSGSDLSSSTLEIEEDCCRSSTTRASPAKRRLTFNHKVEVREYCVTVGDHPVCSDDLPLSLDWSHAPAYCTDIQHSKNRGFYYQAPRRLSLQDRRKRLSKVADYSDEILDALMYCSRHPVAAPRGTMSLAKRMLRHLQQSWRVVTSLDQEHVLEVEEEYICSADDLEDANDDGLEEEKKDMVLVWERNHDLQQSQSLYDDGEW